MRTYYVVEKENCKVGSFLESDFADKAPVFTHFVFNVMEFNNAEEAERMIEHINNKGYNMNLVVSKMISSRKDECNDGYVELI